MNREPVDLEDSETSLYERLGGERATQSLVGALYFQILNDSRLARFFDGANVGMLLRHQKDFLSIAFGGEAAYAGRSMREAHHRLVEKRGLNDEHFDALVEITTSVLRDLGYADSLVEEAVNRLELLRGEVLGRDETCGQ
ncbi:MAG: group 1 truncated hemoglobin [Pseudomonadota bacterium]